MAVTTTDGAVVSWEELFAEFAPALVSYARSKGVRASEDLVQDVLVTAVEKLSGFVGDRRGLRSWLFTITYRRIADEHRRFYRSPETLVGEHSQTIDQGTDVADGLLREEMASEALAAMDVLRDRERAVLEMRIIEEAPVAEVAGRLGISTGNVRVIQARALAKLRNHLMSRNESTPGSIAYGAMPFVFIRYLASDVPHDHIIGPWVERVRIAASGGIPYRVGTRGLTAAMQGVSGGISNLTGTAIELVLANAGKVALVLTLTTAPVLMAGDIATVTSTTPPAATTFAPSLGAADLAVPLSDHVTPTTGPATASPSVTPVPPVESAEAGEGAGAGRPAAAPEPVGRVEPEISNQKSPQPSQEGGGGVDATVVDEGVESVIGVAVEPLVDETVATVDGTIDSAQEAGVEPLVEEVDSVVDSLPGVSGLS